MNRTLWISSLLCIGLSCSAMETYDPNSFFRLYQRCLQGYQPPSMNESLTHFLERALAYQHNPENLEMGDELLVDGANLNCIRLAQLEYCLKRFDKGIEHVWSVPNDRKGDFLEFIRHEIKRPDIAEYYLQVYMSPKHATR